MHALQVSYAAQQSLKNYSHRAFDVPSDPLYKSQWSLVCKLANGSNLHCITVMLLLTLMHGITANQLNTGQTGGPAGRDLNVVPAWMQGFTGKGVVVAVVDDGRLNKM